MLKVIEMRQVFERLLVSSQKLMGHRLERAKN